MTHEPPRRPRAKRTPPAGRPASARPEPDAPGGDSERPTVNPPFDVEAFARASALSPLASDAGRAAPGQRRAPADAPTVRPPAPDGTIPEPRAEQITLTNEVELEEARAQIGGGLRSARRGRPRVPPPQRGAALSHAGAALDGQRPRPERAQHAERALDGQRACAERPEHAGGAPPDAFQHRGRRARRHRQRRARRSSRGRSKTRSPRCGSASRSATTPERSRWPS